MLADPEPAHPLQVVSVGPVDGDDRVEPADEHVRRRGGSGGEARRPVTVGSLTPAYWNAERMREKSP